MYEFSNVNQNKNDQQHEPDGEEDFFDRSLENNLIQVLYSHLERRKINYFYCVYVFCIQ